MRGAIAGDIIGSVHDHAGTKIKSFPLFAPHSRFTDDSALTAAVPEKIIAFLASENFEDAIRNAISFGGEADTLACIASAIAESFYGGVPGDVAARATALFDGPLNDVLDLFSSRSESLRNTDASKAIRR